MKTYLIALFVIALTGVMFGQSYVDFRNNTGENISTNNTVDLYGNSTGLSGSGLTSGSGTAPLAYYYVLLMQPYSGGLTQDPTALTLLSTGWLFTGIGATNTVNAGRLGGGPAALTLENDPVGNDNQFVVAGWSANLAGNGPADG